MRIRVLAFTISVFALFTETGLFARDVVYIVRSASPRDRLDTIMEPKASRGLQWLIKNWSREIRTKEIVANSLSDIENIITQDLQADEEMKGLILLGHGSPYSFELSGQKSFSGAEVGLILKSILSNLPSSKEVFLYLNSCVSFLRGDPQDYGFETELVAELIKISVFDEVPTEKIHLIGHRGVAGFGDLLPRIPTDLIFEQLNVQPKVQTQVQIKSQLKKILVGGVLTGMLPGFISNLQIEGLEVSPFTSIALLGTSLGVSGIGFLAYWNHISKMGRIIHIDSGTTQLDADISIREALYEALRGKSCKKELSQLGSAKI